MKLTRCAKNRQHYFDLDKFDECPHCLAASAAAPDEKEEGGMMDDTRSIIPDSMTDELPDALRSVGTKQEAAMPSSGPTLQPEESFEETLRQDSVGEDVLFVKIGSFFGKKHITAPADAAMPEPQQSAVKEATELRLADFPEEPLQKAPLPAEHASDDADGDLPGFQPFDEGIAKPAPQKEVRPVTVQDAGFLAPEDAPAVSAFPETTAPVDLPPPPPAQPVKKQPGQTPPAAQPVQQPMQTPPAQPVMQQPMQTPPAQPVMQQPMQAAPGYPMMQQPMQAAPGYPMMQQPMQAAPGYPMMQQPMQAPMGYPMMQQPMQTPPPAHSVMQQQANSVFRQAQTMHRSEQPMHPDNTAGAQQNLAQAVAAAKERNVIDDGKTMAFYQFEDVEPVVGWLIGLSGFYFGESFNLKAGQNFIGRALTNDIALTEEKSVSRECHAIVIFDPQKRRYYIQPGRSRSLIYVGGELLMQYRELRIYDKIQLGDSLYLFMPLCGRNFSWDAYTDVEV